MSLGKLELKKKHTKANVNFFFDRNLKGSVRVQYYDVIEGIYLRNMDFFFLLNFYRIPQFVLICQWLTCDGKFCYK